MNTSFLLALLIFSVIINISQYLIIKGYKIILKNERKIHNEELVIKNDTINELQLKIESLNKQFIK